MTRTVTLSGGELDGLRFDVPDEAEAVVHHAAHGGAYFLTGELGVWTPEVEPQAIEAAAEHLGGLEEFLPTDLLGLVAHARIGRRVLIVGNRHEDSRDLWEKVADVADDASAIERSNGSERIRFAAGGWIAPVSVRSKRWRGVAADVLFVAADVTDEALKDLLPILAASKVAVVLHEKGRE